MRLTPDGSVDLIIADPPYNRGVAEWDKYELNDYLKFMNECLIEFKRILKPSGNLFMYNQQPYASYMVTEALKHFNYTDEIIWYYKNGGSGGKKLKNAHQLLYWFTLSDSFTKNLDDVRVPYSGTREIYKHNVDKNPAKAWTPDERGAIPSNVWEISIVRQTEKTELTKLGVQKPLAICERIVKLGSNKGDTVFIPFAGSGSECLAAISNDRNYIGAELNQNYINIANKRIEDYLNENM